MSLICPSGPFLSPPLCPFPSLLYSSSAGAGALLLTSLSGPWRLTVRHGTRMQTAAYTMYNFPADKSQPEWRLTGCALGRGDRSVIHCKSVFMRRRGNQSAQEIHIPPSTKSVLLTLSCTSASAWCPLSAGNKSLTAEGD